LWWRVDRLRPIRVAPVLLTAAFLLFGGWHWARLEQPHMSVGSLALLAVLAALPTLVAIAGGGRAATIVTAIVVTVAAIGEVMHTWPWQTRHGVYPARVVELVVRGLRDWFGTHTPIDAGRFAGADHDLRLAFFAGAAALAWLIVRRGSGLAGIGVAFAMFAMPSTVLPLHADGFRAGLFLLLALLTLVATAHRTGRPLAGDAQIVGLSVAVMVAGLIVGTAPGVTKSAFLAWQTWNPLSQQGPLVSVDYMWNQTYAPLRWPKKRTTVLQVTSSKEMYWRAATLDTFAVDHWQFSPTFGPVATSTGGFLDVPPQDLPINETVGHNNVDVKVKVLGLADNHLIGAGQPVRWALPGGTESLLDADGTVTTLNDVARDTTYSLTTYDANPQPSDLNKAKGPFPRVIRDGIMVANQQIPAWPQQLPAGVQVLDEPFMRASAQAWARSKAARATDEYEAVIAVENYFRSAPFKYTLTPHLPQDLPALAGFMLKAHAGYCQMFSGAMALVLRLHGIPARVAVGFTPGKLQGSDTYVVNDRDAHAWVEVYFPNWGWIPFEPTPGSHLPTDTSSSSPAFRKVTTGIGISKQLGGFLAGVIGAKKTPPGVQSARLGGHGNGGGGGQVGVIDTGSGSSHGRFITWLFTAALAVIAAVLLLKAASVRWRYLRRGPRARAGAAYRDLATFVGDQGLTLRPDETFAELAERLQATFGVDAGAFARSATIARYAALPAAEQESRRLRGQVRRIKKDVRERLTPRERAAGALRLRTVLSQATLGG
jgi:Transglutaminase-like superfamily/TgpA N-terminal domain